MVPCLMSKSLRHFEFVFAYGVSTCFNFTDFHAAVQLSQQDLLKRFFVSQSCLLCQRLIDLKCLGLFLFYHVALICFCLCQYHTISLAWFYSAVWIHIQYYPWLIYSPFALYSEISRLLYWCYCTHVSLAILWPKMSCLTKEKGMMSYHFSMLLILPSQREGENNF